MKTGLIVFTAAAAIIFFLIASFVRQGGNSSVAASGTGSIAGKGVTSFSLENKREIATRGFPPSPGGLDQFYPCDKGLQSSDWTLLSPEERMLANGWEELDAGGKSFEPPKEKQPVRRLASLIAGHYHLHRKIPKTIEELVASTEEMARKYAMDPAAEGMDYSKYYEDLLVSPVTGKPLTWNNPNFSAGNVFIAVVNEKPDALAQAHEDWKDIAAQYNASNKSGKTLDDSGIKDRIFIYARVYGTSGVITNWCEAFDWAEPGGQEPCA